MLYTITNRYGRRPDNALNQVFLTWDDWNDFSFYTLFGIFYVDANNEKHDLGSIKIAYYGQLTGRGERRLETGDTFDKLDEDFFSVGLDDSYYVNLNSLGVDIKNRILSGLNDVAKNLKILNKAQNEEVFKVSFLRGLSITTIKGQFNRLATGKARLTPYDFTFTSPSKSGVNSISMEFHVIPNSNPPTNIHILIGRNGVGKTFMINSMINTLTSFSESDTAIGKFTNSQRSRGNIFSNLICITFSAFDEFKHPPEQRDKSQGLQYFYIGLKSENSEGKLGLNDTDGIVNQFLSSLYNCKLSSRDERWKNAIAMLETDPMFRSAEIGNLIDLSTQKKIEETGRKLFSKLSTGHKIILLTITRLVEKLEERSLVLIDEPESHLHPPLLSSFMRALADLLIDTNGVGIIATHSPVVLQEVPKSCVYKLRRNGKEAIAERLKIESFGENVGVLTQEVFGLEVTESGFHSILKKVVENNDSYLDALAEFEGELGLEAKAILRTLIYQKNKRND